MHQNIRGLVKRLKQNLIVVGATGP